MIRVCILNADAPASTLRYHRITAGRFSPDGFRGLVSACGCLVDGIWGINSIRLERAEAMGAKPCRKCFPAHAALLGIANKGTA